MHLTSSNKLIPLREYIVNLVLAILFVLPVFNFSQEIGDIIVIPVQVNPDQTVKSFEKLNDRPTMVDSSRRIDNIIYNITTKPVKTTYIPSPINAEKFKPVAQNKIPRLLLKAGYGNYNMPYGELFLNSVRNKENAYGLHYKHLSSDW